MNTRFSHILAAIAALFLAIPVPAQDALMRLGTVVIDAGHGGKDAGCVSKDQKTYEKNIALDISKRLSQKISAAYPEVKVKMTRTDDTFVELENRAVFANKAGANLFISIHVNAVDGSTAANGYSIHCLGQSSRKGNDLFSKNLDLVKRENSVIKLEKDYSTKYQGFDPDDPQSSIIFNLMQNAHLGQSLEFAADVAEAMKDGPIKTNRGVSQDPFWVLWRTAMPAVLIEVGFMTNPQDLTVLRSEIGRDAIAQNIFKAFCVFKAKYDREAPVITDEPAKPVIEAPVAPVAQAAVAPEAPAAPEAPVTPPAAEQASTLYGIQVLVSSKDLADSDSFFAGHKPTRIKAGTLTKYVIDVSPSLQAVKKKYPSAQMKFPDSYIVKIKDGTTAPVR